MANANPAPAAPATTLASVSHSPQVGWLRNWLASKFGPTMEADVDKVIDGIAVALKEGGHIAVSAATDAAPILKPLEGLADGAVDRAVDAGDAAAKSALDRAVGGDGTPPPAASSTVVSEPNDAPELDLTKEQVAKIQKLMQAGLL